MSRDDLKAMYDLINEVTDPAQLAAIKRHVDWRMKNTARITWRVGQRIHFTSKGSTWAGTIERVNQKTVSVYAVDKISGPSRRSFELGARVPFAMIEEVVS
jgi:hypothetical protein